MCPVGVEGRGFSDWVGLECSDWIMIDCSDVQACHYLNSNEATLKSYSPA